MLNHLGIIPDGTRRWAKKNNISYYNAYLKSMQKLKVFLNIGFDNGVNIQSIYGLSKDNLARSDGDLSPVFEAETFLIESILPNLCDTYNCSVHLAGKSSLLPEPFYKAIVQLIEETKKYQKTSTKKIYLLLGYSPWDEIDFAVKNAKNNKPLKKYLWVKEELDLVIRTGGGKLISNFLPLQSGYAELLFFDQFFNDLSIETYKQAIIDFPHYGTRLGGK
jgi:undecaprenyl diphosphate synthase